MKRLHLSSLFSIILFLQSCDDLQPDSFNKDETLIDLSGYVQKEPFLNGTTMSIYERTDELVQTGLSFDTQGKDNSGNFDTQV